MSSSLLCNIDIRLYHTQAVFPGLEILDFSITVIKSTRTWVEKSSSSLVIATLFVYFRIGLKNKSSNLTDHWIINHLSIPSDMTHWSHIPADVPDLHLQSNDDKHMVKVVEQSWFG